MIRDLARLSFACAAIFAASALRAPDLRAQQPDTLVVAATVPSATQTGVELPDVTKGTTPGGAFLRALILPGWGHASIGSYTRGGFYFITESTTGFMIARTIHRIGIAKDARNLKESRVREALVAAHADVEADSIDVLLGRDPEVLHGRHLVEARRQQLQDWNALGIFLLFIGAADAFVSAHLRDFPGPVGIEASAAPGGSTGLAFKVPLGGPYPRR